MIVKRDALRELAARIDVVADDPARAALLDRLAAVDRPFVIAFANAHAANLAARDPAFLDLLLGADLLLRDGAGMAILFRLLGRPPGLNMNGTDFIPQIAARFTGRAAALLGTREPWLSAAAEKLFPGAPPPLRLDGYQDDAKYLDALQAQPAEIVILAMGMPRQERIAAGLKSGLARPCVLVNGGAVLDFYGDRFSRAPVIFRRLGLEWLYRLILEPRRLFGRYVLGNAVFLYRCLALALSSRDEKP